VAVVTYQRPEYVQRCLDHLLAQTVSPNEIIVVDSSDDDATARLVRERFPSVTYEVCKAGRGSTATARNIAYQQTKGDVLAFVDDDAFAEPQWLERLLLLYDDPTVGGVGGRQIRTVPGELDEGKDAIGLLLPNGTVTGNFAADPGHPVEVDHLLGANMSFRRSAIDQVGGIRDGYRGTCLREETDLCLHISAVGYRLIFTPDAVVEHVAGPYAKGTRFDTRYQYWAQKNHIILLIRNFGLGAPIVRAFFGWTAHEVRENGTICLARVRARARQHDFAGAMRAAGSAARRPSILVAATLAGIWTGLALSRRDGAAAPRSQKRSIEDHSGSTNRPAGGSCGSQPDGG
jgi:GT2 family glycosyltransferase